MVGAGPRDLLAVAAALVVTGCSGAQGPTPTAAPTPTTTPPSGAPSGTTAAAEGLAAGLLPADAFDDDAVVRPISVAGVADNGTAPGLDLTGASITPEACGPAIEHSRPRVDGVTDLAAQFASTGAPTVAQVLVVGGPDGVVGDLAAAPATCPQAELTSPVFGTATITLAAFDVPDLGDDSAGLVSTTEITEGGAVQLTTTVLVAVVADGDRVLWVVSSDVGAVPDPVAFTALVQQAFDRQADQLD